MSTSSSASWPTRDRNSHWPWHNRSVFVLLFFSSRNLHAFEGLHHQLVPRHSDIMEPLNSRRRDGRVAEGARLESVYTLTGIGGSNPPLSARTSYLSSVI